MRNKKKEKIVVSVSGGKDSTALYAWAIERYGKDGFLAVFADTGNEHPVTLNYLRNLPEKAGGPDICWVKADFTAKLKHRKGIEATGIPFLDLIIYKNRVPSARAQFCTEYLKMIPIRIWIEETFEAEDDVLLLTGIRRGESARRSRYDKREYLEFYECFTERPLIDWTEEDVFGYLKARGIEPNPLYKAGFKRVGCFPCIHAGKQELSRLPEWAWKKIS